MIDRFNTLMLRLRTRLQVLGREEGQGTVEYALVLFFVVALAGVLTEATGVGQAVRNGLTSLATNIGNGFTSATG